MSDKTWFGLSSLRKLFASKQLLSFTVKQLLDGMEWNYFKKKERSASLETPVIGKVYASTVIYRTKSSKFATNGKIWEQKILFRDFVALAKDKQISIDDAISYAINDGDVSVRCSCPSHLYWGWAYVATQLGYLYGIPREGRAPKRNNIKLHSLSCKHVARVLQQIYYKDEGKLAIAFGKIYRKVPETWLEAVEETPVVLPREEPQDGV